MRGQEKLKLRILISIDNVYGLFNSISLINKKDVLLSLTNLLIRERGGWMHSKPPYKEELGQKVPPAQANMKFII